MGILPVRALPNEINAVQRINFSQEGLCGRFTGHLSVSSQLAKWVSPIAMKPLPCSPRLGTKNDSIIAQIKIGIHLRPIRTALVGPAPYGKVFRVSGLREIDLPNDDFPTTVV